MNLYLAVPEHAVRITLSLATFLILTVGLVSAAAAADEQEDRLDEAVETSSNASQPGSETEVAPEGLADDGVEDGDDSAAQASTNEGSELTASNEEETATENAPEVVELTPHSAEYRVKISVLSGRLNTRLSRTENGYEANHGIRPTGLARMMSGGTIEEFSSFESTAQGMVPVRYVSDDSLTSDKTRADVEFDWQNNTITGTVNDQAVEVVLEEFAHDRVSTQYQLMSDLMNGGVAERYVLFDIDEIKILNVTVVGTREIRVPAGEFTAIGIQHQAEGSSRTTTMWCVEDLDFLPVLIEQHRRGELKMRASLRSYSPVEG